MTDTFTPQQRSEIMSRIIGKNTSPEIAVRKILYSLGCRYRLHDRKLSGKPDVVIRRLKTVIFINGCFWHKHNCGKNVSPNTNAAFWAKKLNENVRRQKEDIVMLRKSGWKPLIFWECQTKEQGKLTNLLLKRLWIKQT